MLLGPAILGGFFGIAAAHEAGRKPGLAAIAAGLFVAFLLYAVSAFAMPLLPLTLPWLAYASRALYRQVVPLV